jgi:hypothetical protein
MSENIVLRQTAGSQTDKEAGHGEKCKGEFHNLYSSSNIVAITKSRGVK